jgi:ABC-2 type transport system permease protein
MILPVVFAAINRSLLTGVSFAMCFIAMTTGYTFSIVEKNAMERLYGILPIRKSDLVVGRYIFIIIMGLTALIFSLIVHPVILTFLGVPISAAEFAGAATIGIFLFALYTVFQLPGYYKLGSIKGRVFMYIPVAGFLATLLLIAKLPAGEGRLLSAVIHSPVLLMLSAVIFVAAMYAISILVSIKILKNKEM